MSLPLLDLHEMAVSDFRAFIGLGDDMPGGLISVGTARLEESKAPAWLLEYRLADFTGLDRVRSWIPIPDSIERSAPARQASFVFGRIAARAGARCHSGNSAPVTVGPLGAPIWPEGLSGSISHTDRHAIAWVERREGAHIGIDLERRMSGLDARELCEQIMSKREAERLAAAFGGEDWPEAVTLLFSAKEAAYKALSPLVGRYMDFHEVELDEVDSARGSIWLIGPPGFSRARIEVRFAALGESILTYAVAGSPPNA